MIFLKLTGDTLLSSGFYVDECLYKACPHIDTLLWIAQHSLHIRICYICTYVQYTTFVYYSKNPLKWYKIQKRIYGKPYRRHRPRPTNVTTAAHVHTLMAPLCFFFHSNRNISIGKILKMWSDDWSVVYRWSMYSLFTHQTDIYVINQYQYMWWLFAGDVMHCINYWIDLLISFKCFYYESFMNMYCTVCSLFVKMHLIMIFVCAKCFRDI